LDRLDKPPQSNHPSAGKSYVIFGKTDTGAVNLSKLGNESKYTIDYLNASVADLGEI
jgi:hypothetical protein